MSKLLTLFTVFCLSSSAFALTEAAVVSEIIRKAVDSKKFQEEVLKNSLKESDLVAVSFKPLSEINSLNAVEAVYKSKSKECTISLPVQAALSDGKVVIETFGVDSTCK